MSGLDLDLAPNFHEVGWRDIEQIDSAVSTRNGADRCRADPRYV
jgi:hypothetical protein